MSKVTSNVVLSDPSFVSMRAPLTGTEKVAELANGIAAWSVEPLPWNIEAPTCMERSELWRYTHAQHTTILGEPRKGQQRQGSAKGPTNLQWMQSATKTMQYSHIKNPCKGVVICMILTDACSGFPMIMHDCYTYFKARAHLLKPFKLEERCRAGRRRDT